MSYAAACQLMRLGFRLFPVIATYDARKMKWKKKPLTPGGFKDATSSLDEAEVFKRSNVWIGMVHDHMTVIDADGQRGVETLNRILPLLPEAAIVNRTISGGIHYIIPGTAGESRDVRGLPGVDILTGNNKGFIIVPPSPGYTTIAGSFEDLAEGINGQQLDGSPPISGGSGEAP